MLLALVGLLAACSSDDIAEEQPNGTDVATLTLRIGTPEATAVTRAAGSTYGKWNDAKNATTDRLEMMYNWYVVIVDAQNKVVFVKEKTEVPQDDAEIDVVEENVTLATGSYTAYNFANIAKTALPTALQNPAVNSTLSAADIAAIDAATFAVNGNNFTPSETNGIPMSNKQPLTIDAGDTEKDLIVVRMLAKMEIRLYNETGAAVNVTSVLLSDVTKNPTDNENAANLKLLPAWTTADATAGPNNMNVTEHGGLQPNVATTAKTADFIYAVPTDEQTVGTATYTDANSPAAKVYTFYINETKKPANAFQRFTLTIETEVTTGSTTTHRDQRFALIDDSNVTPHTNDDDATNDQGKWDYIARNDYRIIPVVLDDYRLELVPYDFPAIGVYPASVKEEDGRFTINFHDYGHFHLVPYVTKISTGESVPFFNGEGTAPKPSWQLLPASSSDNTPFASSWKTYTELNGEPLDNGNTATTSGNGEFYRIETTPATVDGDEVGGVPVWYDNDNTTSPQWSPKGDGNYPPFIFGYIEDPEVAGGEYWDATHYTMTKDKSIYHEFTVTLNRGNGTNRLLKAGVLMILDKDQVLYARSTARGPRRLHSCH